MHVSPSTASSEIAPLNGLALPIQDRSARRYMHENLSIDYLFLLNEQAESVCIRRRSSRLRLGRRQTDHEALIHDLERQRFVRPH